MSKGKEAIQNALIGIAIVLTAGALITYGLRALGVKDDFLSATEPNARTTTQPCPEGLTLDIDTGRCVE